MNMCKQIREVLIFCYKLKYIWTQNEVEGSK